MGRHTAEATFEIIPSHQPRPRTERERLIDGPEFGAVFTDHMARATWTPERGWHRRRVEPYGPLQIEPAGAVLHYTQTILEGLKAYRHPDGSVWTFRLADHAARFAASARRLALPELSEADFADSVQSLVETDAQWVPQPPSTVYLRPVMFGTEPSLAVQAANEVEYVLIATPAGAYFGSGFEPVSIWVSAHSHRAAPGGTGSATCGANYAASLLAQQQAAENGCDQVCFLDAATATQVEELGGMNVFFVDAGGAVHTPALTETFLAGITRGAVIELLTDAGRTVHERAIGIDEVYQQLGSGQLTEAFACGTGAVVTPIGRLKSDDVDICVPGPGPLSTQVHAQLTDIQFGRAPDPRDWMQRLV